MSAHSVSETGPQHVRRGGLQRPVRGPEDERDDQDAVPLLLRHRLGRVQGAVRGPHLLEEQARGVDPHRKRTEERRRDTGAEWRLHRQGAEEDLPGGQPVQRGRRGEEDARGD